MYVKYCIWSSPLVDWDYCPSKLCVTWRKSRCTFTGQLMVFEGHNIMNTCIVYSQFKSISMGWPLSSARNSASSSALVGWGSGCCCCCCCCLLVFMLIDFLVRCPRNAAWIFVAACSSALGSESFAFSSGIEKRVLELINNNNSSHYSPTARTWTSQNVKIRKDFRSLKYLLVGKKRSKCWLSDCDPRMEQIFRQVQIKKRHLQNSVLFLQYLTECKWTL